MNNTNQKKEIYNSILLKKLSSTLSKYNNKFDCLFYILLSLNFLIYFLNSTYIIPSDFQSHFFYNLLILTIKFCFVIVGSLHIIHNLLPSNLISSDKYMNIFITIIAFMYLFFSFSDDSSEIFDFLFCIAACAGKSSKKILKYLLWGGSAIMLSAILLSQAGLINDWIILPGRHSLGTNYCTDCGAHILFLAIIYIIYKEYQISISNFLILLFLFELCFFIVMAKTASICIFLLIIGLFIEKIYLVKFKKSFLRLFRYFMLLIFPIAYTVFSIFTVIYTLSPSFFPNNTFTSRLDLTSKGFQMYDLSFFSQEIIQHGNGGNNGAAINASSNSVFLFDIEKNGLSHFLYAIFILFFITCAIFLLNKKKSFSGISFAIIASMLLIAPGIAAILGDRSFAMHKVTTDYFWLDCSYIRILLSNGIIVFLTIMIISSYIQWKALLKKDYLFMFIMCIIALDCTIEHHLTDISYNIIFMLAFTDYLTSKSNV